MNNIKIIRMNIINGYPGIKAFCDIEYYDLEIKGLKVVEGNNGLFVSMPSEKGKNGKYYNIVWVKDINTKQEIENAILDIYRKKTENNNVNNIIVPEPNQQEI